MPDDTRTAHEVIAGWIGDTSVLVGRVESALDHQIELTSERPTLTTTVQRFLDTVRADRRRVAAYRTQYGSTAAAAMIEHGSVPLGRADGASGQMRHESVTGALRDNETAFNRVALAYAMLHAAAMASNDSATEAFAGEGMKTWARMVQEINQVISETVVLELADTMDDPAPRAGVVEQCLALVNQAWHSTA